MVRLIDEKKLIEKVEKMVIPLSTPDGSESIDIGINGYNECLVDVLETIKDQPKVGEWIPVEERLPKHDGDYLIQAINDYEGIYMDVSSYDSQYKSFSYDGVEDHNVIAWMDLPKMYEVKE